MACMISVIRDVRAGQGRSFNDIDAVRVWLAPQPPLPVQYQVIEIRTRCLGRKDRCIGEEGCAEMQGSQRWAVIDTGPADPHLHGLIVTTTQDHAHSRRTGAPE